jgi:hypothetical protein
MFPFFFSVDSTLLAQAIAPQPQEILRPQEVRALPNGLDPVPVFNSNSPELVLKPGILLSTFPGDRKAHPDAHLDYLFPAGRFDIFAHHIAKADPPEDLRTLYMAVVAHNPTETAIAIDFLAGASYLSQPDAPFLPMDSFLENPTGQVYAGPGSRVMSDLIRDRLQPSFPLRVVIPPGATKLLLNAPIPVRELDPPINGRSTYLRLQSNGPLYLASLAQFAPTTAAGEERAPRLREWLDLLAMGDVAGPRDRAPTPLDSTGQFLYGRVAGVAIGSQWDARVTDGAASTRLTIPAPGAALSYGVSLLDRGTLGTGQVQSAELVRRYPDTAYRAHGNYGVEYDLDLPLYNPTNAPRTVTVALETPIKFDQPAPGLRFFEPLPSPTFFRGTVRVRYRDDQGQAQQEYYHLIHRRGQAGTPLVTVTLQPGEERLVNVNLAYPPDATPPQVVTIQTLE